MADIAALRRQQALLRQLGAVQSTLSLVARQKLLLDRRQERVAKAGEAMQREARDAAIARWDRARSQRSFDPLLTAAASDVAVRRHAEWDRADGAAQAATVQCEAASARLQQQLQREDVAEVVRERQARRMQNAADGRDHQFAEDVIAHRLWEGRRA